MKLKGILWALAAAAVVLAVCWVIYVSADMFMDTGALSGGATAPRKDSAAASQNESTKAPTAAPTAAAAKAAPAPGGGVAAESKELRKRLEALEGEAAQLPILRQKALAKEAGQPAAYEKAVENIGPNVTEVRKEFEKLDEKIAALNVPADSASQSAALTGDLKTLADTVTTEMRSRSLPSLALLALLLSIALLQLASLVMHSRRLAGARRDLLERVQKPLDSLIAGKGLLAQQVASTAEAVGKLGSDQPPLVAQAAKIVAALDNLPGDAGDRREVEKGDAGKAGERARADEDSSWPRRETEVGREVDWAEDERVKPHDFPAPVGEYMNLVKDSARRMKPDYMNDVLVEDPENKGVLVLVKDPPAIKDGTSYIVPWMNYFRSEQEYIKNYSNYFDCSEQPVGHVWISKPATVRKVADGWALVDRGVLEVRQ